MRDLIPEHVAPVEIVFTGLQLTGGMKSTKGLWFKFSGIIHRILITMFLSSGLVESLTGGKNLLYKIQSLLATFVTLHTYMKFINVLFHQGEVEEIFTRLNHLRLAILNDGIIDDNRYMKNADRMSRKYAAALIIITLVYTPLAFVMAIWYYCSAKENEELQLAFPVFIPWDYNKLSTFLAAHLVIEIYLLTGQAVFISVYLVLLIFTFQVSGLLNTLQESFLKNGITKRNYEQHIDLVKIVIDYNDLFSAQMYFEILLSALQPCGFGYIALKQMKKNSAKALDALYKLMLSLGFPCLMCVCGEKINSQLAKLHESAYSSQWFHGTAKERKNLFIVTTATSSPPTLNYKRLITFNLICFATVAQGAYSYLTMLINLEED